jgi:phthalate 4,5-dioxygenase oxygenase subunit
VPDAANLVPSRGGRERRWGQDRSLVKAGHFTGFSETLIEEDVVVQVSMGPIVDRTAENISSSDVAIVQLRKLLLQSLREAEAGALPPGSGRARGRVRVANPLDVVLDAGAQWDFDQGREAA